MSLSPDLLVVVGLGYVGLPLARAASAAAVPVVGFDLNEARVADLNAGSSHVDDVSDDDLATMLAAGFRATTDPACLDEASVAVICVPTPLEDDGSPDLRAVEAATRTVRDHVHAGMLVVLESTTYPLTTEEVVQPILEESGLSAGADFHLAFSPERIDPGNERFGVSNTPRIVGGLTPGCTAAAERFYSKFVDQIVTTRRPREAEMAKLLENTYRQVNIALVNEMAVFCHELGVDLWDAIDAASTKPFGFQAFYPGPGVGGHCIPIDPHYLSYRIRKLGYAFRFVDLAQDINARMPTYVAARVQGLLNDRAKPVKGSKILMLGVTYKPDVGDERDSPAQPLGRRLLELGADLRFHDPHVERWRLNGVTLDRVADLDAEISGADCVVLVQAHKAYDLDTLVARASLVFDTRGLVSGDNVERL